MMAAVLNRPGSLGPAPGKRSRGELPFVALDADTADAAASRIAELDAGAWRSFNLVVADRDSAWFVRGVGAGRPEAMRLTPGLHMITAHDPDDRTSPRTARHLPRFAAAPSPEPPDWSAWAALMADREGPPGAAINVPSLSGFGTVCSSLLGIPDRGPPQWLFAAGPPDRTAFTRVPLARGRHGGGADPLL